MASSYPNKSFPMRAAAILTNAEVKGNNFDINSAAVGELSMRLAFTKGSLTNVIVKLYGSSDGTTFFDLAPNGNGSNTFTLTADTSMILPVYAPGVKFFTVGLTGTGTVTSSSATVDVLYFKRGSQV